MKNSFIDSFKSKVILKISGKNIERFIERIIHSKIEILDLKYNTYKEIIIKVYEKEYEKILKMKSIYDIEVKDFTGLIKIKKTLNFNKIFFLSLMIGMIILITLSNLILKIEVIHSDANIKDLITKDLNNNGIKLSSFKKEKEELEKIKKLILQKYKDKIEWLEIIEKGTKYIVRVEERKIIDNEEDNTPQHIIAKKDAVIKKVVASSGEILKNINSYVKQGDIVISGEIRLNEELKNMVKAEGKVYGEVWYKVDTTIPFVYYEEKYTNRKKELYSFRFLNINIKVGKSYKNKREERDIIFKHLFLPISIDKLLEREIQIISKTYTLDEAIEEGIKKSRTKIEDMLNKEEYIIDEKQLQVKIKDSKIELVMFYTVYEDITDVLKIS